MMRWILVLGMVGLALQASAIPRVNQSQVALSPALGYTWFDGKRAIDSTLLPSVALGYYIDRQWRIQFRIGGFHADSRTEEGESGTGMLYSGEGFFYLLPACRIEPYLVAGLGTIHLTDPHNNEANVETNFSGGIGVEYFLDQTASLYIDVRDRYTPDGGKNDIGTNVGISFFLFRLPSHSGGAGKKQSDAESAVFKGRTDDQGIITVGLSDDSDVSSGQTAAATGAASEQNNDNSGVIVVSADRVSREEASPSVGAKQSEIRHYRH